MYACTRKPHACKYVKCINVNIFCFNSYVCVGGIIPFKLVRITITSWNEKKTFTWNPSILLSPEKRPWAGPLAWCWACICCWTTLYVQAVFAHINMATRSKVWHRQQNIFLQKAGFIQGIKLTEECFGSIMQSSQSHHLKPDSAFVPKKIISHLKTILLGFLQSVLGRAGAAWKQGAGCFVKHTWFCTVLYSLQESNRDEAHQLSSLFCSAAQDWHRLHDLHLCSLMAGAEEECTDHPTLQHQLSAYSHDFGSFAFLLALLHLGRDQIHGEIKGAWLHYTDTQQLAIALSFQPHAPRAKTARFGAVEKKTGSTKNGLVPLVILLVKLK
jgi:hypothetical protein